MIQQLALGQAGLSYNDYCRMSFGCLMRAIYGNHKARQETIQSGWEQARFIASTMVKEANNIVFPWEKQNSTKQEPKRITKEEFQKVLELYGKK